MVKLKEWHVEASKMAVASAFLLGGVVGVVGLPWWVGLISTVLLVIGTIGLIANFVSNRRKAS